MRVKNATPFRFGSKITARRPRALEMVLVVRGTYLLKPGEPLVANTDPLDLSSLGADVFAEDDDERAGACLYPSDFADWKPKADVMLKATCYPGGGRSARTCPVRFHVGAWSKTLVVIGRRVWTESLVGKAISDPQPFTSMPLTWAHAFGGPELAQNPAGMGLGSPELPNVEYPGAPLQAKRDRPPPASFGPINPAWPPRSEKLGREYGESYRKKRAPFYAEDFDWSHFNAAPLDQQIPYLRGDEEVVFENMHPDAPVIRASLPALRVRAFVRSDEGSIAEVGFVLDTLFADLDEGRVYLTWRGLTPVREDDLADVKTVLIASEPLAEAPLPAAHYHASLAAYEADPLETEKHMPKGGKEQLAALQAIAAENEASPDRDPLERSISILETKPELFPEEQRPALKEATSRMREAAAKAKEAPPPLDPAARAEKLQGLIARAKELATQARATGADVPKLAELEKVLADPRLSAVTPVPLTPEASQRRPEPGPGADLTGRDLSGQDLSGRDLSGAILDGAILTRTKLAGARLRGARLTTAICAKADLTGADLAGATLTKTVLLGARMVGADLSQATLEQAVLDKADLTGASLERAKANMVAFGSASLSGVNFRGALLRKALASGGQLDGADFTGAELTLCLFLEMKAAGLVLEKARIEQSSFAKSDLRDAKVTDARGQGSIWTGALLDGADFSFAVLPSAQFTEASAKGTIFFGADLRGARFYRAVLDGAKLLQANLTGADLNKASLNATTFRAANLYDAKLLGAKGKGCDFEGAYTARARFEGA